MNRRIRQFFSPANNRLTQLRQGNTIVMIPLTCLMGSLAVVSWLQYNTTQAESSVQQIQQVRLETQRLLTALLDAETEVRGYLLIDTSNFLDRYQSAIVIVPDSLTKLFSLVGDNSPQTAQLQRIQNLAYQRLLSLENTVNLVNSQPDSPALGNLLLNGQQRMQLTRNAIETFLHTEEELQFQRTQRLQQQRALSAIALFVLALIGIGGSYLSAYLLRRMNQKLREREERYRQLIELCPDGIFLEQNGKFIYANPATLQIYGAASLDELLGKSVLDWVHPDSRPAFAQRTQSLHESLCTVPVIEEKLLKFNGETIYVEATATSLMDEGQSAAQFVIRDVTERKQIQQALAEKHAYLLKAQEIGKMGSWEYDCLTESLKWSEQIYRLFGISSTEFSHDYQGFLCLVHPEDREWVDRRVQEMIADQTERNFIHRIILPDLTVRWVHEKAEVVKDAQNQTIKLLGTVQDVTERILAEKALFESKQRLDGILSSIEDVVWSVDIQSNRLLYLNSAAQKISGFPVEDFFAKPQLWMDLVHPSDRHILQNFSRDCIAQGSKDITYRIVRLNGEIRWLHDRAKVAEDDRGVAIRIDGIVTDITERQRAEAEIRRLNQTLADQARESETRYQQIVELAEEGIWVIDGDGITTYVNQAMARMLDYRIEEMIGQPLLNFMDESDRAIASLNLANRKQGSSTPHEFRLKTQKGDFVWTHISTSPVLDEHQKMLWACALVYNVTDRKQAEEKLRHSNERISLINAELARATRLKDEFFASMSHELRTPLNAILGLSEALLEEVYGDLNERQKRSLNTIETSGQHLLELINDILDLSKIESGKMELQTTRTNLNALCESSITFIKQQAHQKYLKINIEIPKIPLEVTVDERRIRQVLVNLLSNSVKFTPDGGKISLKVTPHLETETISLSVEDNGIGIASENIPKLFQPFVQLDSSLSRRYAGTGLGLSLVRRIVELHGGSISLISEVNQGSEFTVTLPWKASTTLKELPTTPDISPLVHLNHALIIEDSDPAAKQIARYLSELGTKVCIHPHGEGTLETALQYRPDLIVLDLILPNLSGWEVLAQLKAHPQTQNIPILIISVVEERQSAIALGASEYLVKPITRQQLQTSLSRIFATPITALSPTALVVTPLHPPSPLILLAEDNEANISTLCDYLQAHGFEVCLARNGVEAVLSTEQRQPQLILMDIQMPEMDGLEAIRRIRSEPENAQIPIIALTALAMPGDRERCLSAGAQEYMTKPVSLKKLVTQINHYLCKE